MTNLPGKPIALGAAASSQIPNRTMKTFVRLFQAAYLRRYFHLRPSGEAEYRRGQPRYLHISERVI